MTAQTRVIRRPAICQDALDAPPTMKAQIIRGALHHEADVRLAPFDAVGCGLRALWGPSDPATSARR